MKSRLVVLLLLLLSASVEAFSPLVNRQPVVQRFARPSRQPHHHDNKRLSSSSSLHLSTPLVNLYSIADQAQLAADCLSSSLSLAAASASPALVSPEPIHTAFSVATFLPQPFWLLMILAPNAKLTKQIMGGLGK
jgi:hypothetical protein